LGDSSRSVGLVANDVSAAVRPRRWTRVRNHTLNWGIELTDCCSKALHRRFDWSRCCLSRAGSGRSPRLPHGVCHKDVDANASGEEGDEERKRARCGRRESQVSHPMPLLPLQRSYPTENRSNHAQRHLKVPEPALSCQITVCHIPDGGTIAATAKPTNEPPQPGAIATTSPPLLPPQQL